ncbi:MAG: hypothetical protein ISR65_12030 [Bacteriovoracaceae bacterium]|nr:hypothetical protein [Candidatus Brocadiales bacterium]MBL6990504.1 hypothetical protein [Bacteriovoracaceae bacterium]MBL7110297.1 hypothetical protein [Candidatus Neomarinimicrobiota bacterium]
MIITLYIIGSLFIFHVAYSIGSYLTSAEDDPESIEDVLKDKDNVKRQQLFNSMEKVYQSQVAKDAFGQQKNSPSMTLSKLSYIKQTNTYRAIREDMGEDHSDYIYDYLAVVKDKNQKEYDQLLQDELEEQFAADAAQDPEKLFDSIKEGIDQLSDSPLEQAQLFEKLAAIPGMEDQTKEALISNMEANPPPEQMQQSDIRSQEDQLKFYQDTPEEMAYDSKYKSLLKVTKDKDEAYDVTISLVKQQQNVKAQRSIASQYLEENIQDVKKFTNDIGIKKSNQLLPDHIEAKRNESGELEFWDHVEPIDKNRPDEE